MKLSIVETQFFKFWNCGNKRIVKSKGIQTFYPYEVQTYNGETWNGLDCINKFHTLKEAKELLKNI